MYYLHFLLPKWKMWQFKCRLRCQYKEGLTSTGHLNIRKKNSFQDKIIINDKSVSFHLKMETHTVFVVEWQTLNRLWIYYKYKCWIERRMKYITYLKQIISSMSKCPTPSTSSVLSTLASIKSRRWRTFVFATWNTWICIHKKRRTRLNI